MEDISCFPTVLVLEGSDGAINHSVTVAGCWLFDSNTKYAQRISLPILDWCCSTDFAKVQFSNVFSATRFKHNKPRKEWKICDNCRNGCKLPCLSIISEPTIERDDMELDDQKPRSVIGQAEPKPAVDYSHTLEDFKHLCVTRTDWSRIL